MPVNVIPPNEAEAYIFEDAPRNETPWPPEPVIEIAPVVVFADLIIV